MTLTYRWICRRWSSSATATAPTKARWITPPILTHRCSARTRSGRTNGCMRKGCGPEKNRRGARASRRRAEERVIPPADPDTSTDPCEESEPSVLDLHPLRRDGLILRVQLVAIDRLEVEASGPQLGLHDVDDVQGGEVLPRPAVARLLKGGRLSVDLLEVGLAAAQQVGPEPAQTRGEVGLSLA